MTERCPAVVALIPVPTGPRSVRCDLDAGHAGDHYAAHPAGIATWHYDAAADAIDLARIAAESAAGIQRLRPEGDDD